MQDQELLKKLAEMENKQWADKALSEIRSQTEDYEYQIIFKTEETGFVSAIAEFSSAGSSPLVCVKNASILRCPRIKRFPCNVLQRGKRAASSRDILTGSSEERPFL